MGRDLKAILCNAVLTCQMSLCPGWLPQGGTLAVFPQLLVDCQSGRF